MEEVIPLPVEVTFLRMTEPPTGAAPALPAGVGVIPVPACTVPFYRYLYDSVGQEYCWWLRRTVDDGRLAAILADPTVSIHVLYGNGEPAGFFELERRWDGSTNLSYFGLMPHAIGHGLGRAFLRAAVDEAWGAGCAVLTVNTCTADHPRALPNYLAMGFEIIRRVREDWPVPASLGMRLPGWARGA